jgi:hypothetical protein
MRLKHVVVASALMLFEAACGSAPVPAQNVTDAKSAISAAEAVNANGVPKAALHLKMAKDQVTQAEALIANGENDEARLVLLRAKSDAELALALARDATMRAEADAALKKVDELGAR